MKREEKLGSVVVVSNTSVESSDARTVESVACRLARLRAKAKEELRDQSVFNNPDYSCRLLEGEEPGSMPTVRDACEWLRDVEWMLNYDLKVYSGRGMCESYFVVAFDYSLVKPYIQQAQDAASRYYGTRWLSDTKGVVCSIFLSNKLKRTTTSVREEDLRVVFYINLMRKTATNEPRYRACGYISYNQNCDLPTTTGDEIPIPVMR